MRRCGVGGGGAGALGMERVGADHPPLQEGAPLWPRQQHACIPRRSVFACMGVKQSMCNMQHRSHMEREAAQLTEEEFPIAGLLTRVKWFSYI